MKKMFILVYVAIMMCACAENEITAGVESHATGKKVSFTGIINNSTKTSIVPDEGGSSSTIVWSTTDHIGVFGFSIDGVTDLGTNLDYVAHANAATTSFDAVSTEVSLDSGEGNRTFYAYYPYSSSAVDYHAVPTGVPATQTYASGDNAAKMFMYSSAISADGNVPLTFNNLFAVIEFGLKCPGITLTQMTIEPIVEAQCGNLAGSVTVDLASPAIGTVTSGSKKITVIFSDGLGLSDIYTYVPIAVLPFTCTGGLQLTFTDTDNNVYTKNIWQSTMVNSSVAGVANVTANMHVRQPLINIVANPNHFTYVRWGNNLGADREALTPLEKYGNQFRVYQSEAKLVLPIVESDIPAGATVAFSHVRKTDNSSGFSLNTQTGRAEIYPKALGETVYPHVHFVSVTVGTGESAITHTFPFFIDQCGYQNGYQIEYTPFVFRVNPKTGGLSSAPIIKDSDGEIFTGGSIDYYTNICFYNLYGPSEHTNDKRLNQDNTGFLKTVWNKYYNAIGQPANYGVRNPMTYWDNVDNNRLSYTGGYFRATDLRFVVNPEKFVDEYGYANGIMTMISKFNSDGVSPHTTATNTTQVTRLIVWFDPNYSE